MKTLSVFHKLLTAIVLMLSCISMTQGQTLTNTSTNYTENFNGITSSSTTLPNTAWRGVRANSANWASGSNARPAMASPNCSNFGNNIYIYRLSNNSALGVMESGSSSTNACYFLQITNSSSATSNITQLVVSWNDQNGRPSTSSSATIAFTHGSSGTSWATPVSNSLSGAGSCTAPSTYGNVTARSRTITGLSIAPGSSYYLRWELNGGSGNSQGACIDDVSVTATYAAVAGVPSAVTGLAVTNVGPTSMQLTWTKPAGTFGTDWDGVILMARATSAVDATFATQNGDGYTDGGNSFTGGGTTNASSVCVGKFLTDANGNVIVTGLTTGTTYHFQAYTYYDNGTTDNWSLGSTTANATANLVNPTSFAAAWGNQKATLSWVNPTGAQGTWWDEVMVVARATSAVSGTPSGNGSGYSADAQFGIGTDINSPNGSFVVYKGTGANMTVTGLTNGTTYHLKIYTRQGSSWSSGVTTTVVPAVNPLEFDNFNTTSYSNNLNTYNGSTMPTGWRFVYTASPTWATASTTGPSINTGPGCSDPGGAFAYKYSNDVSFGILSSGSVTNPANYLIEIENSTTSLTNITSIQVKWNDRIARNNTGSGTNALFHSTDGSTWTSVISNGTGSGATCTGASYSLTTARTATITGLNMTPGTKHYFRFAVSGTSNSRGNAIDDVEIIPTFATIPGTPEAATNLVIANKGATSMQLTWTKPTGVFGTDWSGVVVMARPTTAVDAAFTTQDGTAYTDGGNSITGGGTTNANSICVANVNTDVNGDVIITGLTTGVTYNFKAYAYTDKGGYSVWSVATANVSAVAELPNPTNYTLDYRDQRALASWINPTTTQGVWWDEVVVIAKSGSAPATNPSGDGSTYTADNLMGGGTDISGTNGEFVVYKGIGTNLNLTGLTNGTTYHLKIYTRSGTTWSTGESKSVTPNVNPIELDNNDPTFADNFDSYTTSNSAMPTGWRYINGATPTWAAASSTGPAVSTSTGCSAGGGDFAFRYSSNTAFGNLETGSYSSDANYIVELENSTNSLSNITEFTIEWNDKIARNNSSTSGSIALYRSADGTNWTLVQNNNLTLNTTGTCATATSFSNTYARTATVTGLNIAVGAKYYFRFTVNGGDANSRAPSIDDVEITAGYAPIGIPSNVTALTIANVGPTSMRLTWNKPAGTYGLNWHGVVVVARATDANDAAFTTQDGSALTDGGNSLTGGGSTNNNSIVVANQTTDANGDIIITGLTAGTTYHFQVFSYESATPDDAWSTGTSQVSAVADLQLATGFNATEKSQVVDLAWTTPAGTQGTWWDEVMVIARQGANPTTTPSGNGSTYTANAAFAAGADINSPNGEYVVYKGTGTAVSVTALTNNMDYYFAIYTRLGSTWSVATIIDGTPNNGTNYYSRGSGAMTGAIWSTTANGTGATHTFTSTDNIVVQNGHSVTYSTGFIVKDITIETGGSFTRSGGSDPTYIDLNGDLTNNGTLGTSTTTAQPAFDIMGSSCTVSGTAPIYARRMRKEGSTTGDLDMTVVSGTTLNITWNTGGQGCSIYNDATGTNAGTMNLTIDSGATLTAVGIGGDGASGAATTSNTSANNADNAGINIQVYGTLDAEERIYLGNAGSTTGQTNSTSMTVHEGGVAEMGWIEFRHHNATTASLTVEEGGTLRFTGASVITGKADSVLVGIMQASSANVSLNIEGTVEFAGTGNQIVPALFATRLTGLTVTNPSGIDMPADMLIDGNVLVDANADLDLAGFALTVNGTLSGSGTLTGSSTSDLILNGQGNTVLPAFATGARELRNMVMNRAAFEGNNTITLSSPLTISGNLTCTVGFLDLGTNILDLSGTWSGASANSYIRAASGGGVRRVVAPSTSVSYPLGVNPFHPLIVSHSSAGDALITAVALPTMMDKDNAFPIPTNVVGNFWELTSNIALTNPVVTAQWTAASELFDFDRVDAHVVYRQGNTGNWLSTRDVQPASGVDPFTLQSGNKNGFTSLLGGTTYQIGVADNTELLPLPVQYQQFGARWNGNDAVLGWTTASELNNRGFDVERSVDGKNWTNLGFVVGHGTSLNTQDYSFTDKNAAALGVALYYRVKQSDYNGAVKYSKAVRLNNSKAAQANLNAQLYPNPVQGANATLQLEGLSANESAVVAITTLQGGIVSTKQMGLTAGTQMISLDVSALPAGVYVVQVQGQTIQKSIKFIKQ